MDVHESGEMYLEAILVLSERSGFVRAIDVGEYLTYTEGLCVQCMHIGPYDAEPETIAAMEAFAAKEGYEVDFSAGRYHHEIYLSDARRTSPEKQKTVIRHPIRKREETD